MGASVSHSRLHILPSSPLSISQGLLLSFSQGLLLSFIFSFGEALLPLESGAFLWGQNFWEALLPCKKILVEGPFWAF
jgi:hypothetical protein